MLSATVFKADVVCEYMSIQQGELLFGYLGKLVMSLKSLPSVNESKIYFEMLDGRLEFTYAPGIRFFVDRMQKDGARLRFSVIDNAENAPYLHIVERIVDFLQDKFVCSFKTVGFAAYCLLDETARGELSVVCTDSVENLDRRIAALRRAVLTESRQSNAVKEAIPSRLRQAEASVRAAEENARNLRQAGERWEAYTSALEGILSRLEALSKR